MTLRTSRILRSFAGLALVAGWQVPAHAWWNHDWSYRKELTLDAAPLALPADVSNAVVLVRLHDGVLRFTDVNADGSDLRFVADDDKTPLKFHIEKFDPVFSLGFAWVQVPKLIKAGPVKLFMYYGNAKAVPEGSGKETYGPDYKLVWHFVERGTPAQDVTTYRNNAVTAIGSDQSGLIGNSAKFDGNAVVVLPASSSLETKTNAPITWSAWVKADGAASTGALFSHRDSGRAFVIGINSGTPFAGVADGPGALTATQATVGIADGNWHHLAVVASAAQIALYVDGQLSGMPLTRGVPMMAGAATLGGQGGVNGQPIEQPFKGEMDEVKIASIAVDPAVMALEAKNEGTADKLVAFGVDEAQSSWSTGYFGIIMGSVTLDGWVVIGTLIVMMLISWTVMYRKSREIGRIAKANGVFTSAYRKSRGDFGKLRAATIDGKPHLLDISATSAKLLETSPLLHMFKAGLEELESRLSRDVGAARARTSLSEQSIEAIRATLDASQVREVQSLNKQMVLLTIAISGGPFIGLLGTVVGVMITFAAVAAAGDVNINAIAPGISAALAATVAGLFVAIPALFGYNYLITRIKECSADMHVFVNSFITRMAESYNDAEALQSMTE